MPLLEQNISLKSHQLIQIFIFNSHSAYVTKGREKAEGFQAEVDVCVSLC